MSSPWGTQTITPVAQFIVRPNEVIPSIQPNEDAQSLVFDETNFLPGTNSPAMIGSKAARGSITASSIRPTSPTADMRRRGRAISPGRRPKLLFALRRRQYGPRLGLDRTISNFVAGESLQPTSTPISLMSKQQFDSYDFPARPFRRDCEGHDRWRQRQSRLCALCRAAVAWLGISARGPDRQRFLQVPRPLVGRRLAHPRHVASLLRHGRAGNPDLLSCRLFLWVGYKDDCTTFTVRYASSLSAPASYLLYAGGPIMYNPAMRNPDPDVPARSEHYRRH